jgi:hypothetical protein
MAAEGGMVSPTTGHILHSAGAGMRSRGGGGTVLGGAGDDAGVEGPLSGLGDSLGSVLHGAGYRGPQAAQDDEDSGSETTSSAPAGEPTLRYPSDADLPSQAIVPIGSQLCHGRMNADGSSTVTHMGGAGAPDVPGY